MSSGLLQNPSVNSGIRRAVGPLLEALKSTRKWLRAGAAWGLGKLRDPRAVEPLILLLKDPKKQVRKNAAWALGNIGDKRAVPGLTECLGDEDGKCEKLPLRKHSPSCRNRSLTGFFAIAVQNTD